MNDDEIKNATNKAICALKTETPLLEFSRVHERSVAHRLALQIEPFFSGWNVDCEYDRDGDVRKELDGIVDCDLQRKTDIIIPDIIVHHRGVGGRDNNLLVIEMKKDDVSDTCDAMKLELLTARERRYQYALGLYINIHGGDFHLTWYKDGQIFNPGNASNR